MVRLPAPRASALLRALVVLSAGVVLAVGAGGGGHGGSGHHRAAAPDAPRDLGRYALADNNGSFFFPSYYPPRAPGSVSAVAHDRSALVSWSAGQTDNSKIVNYRVYVDGVQKVQVPASQRSVTVTGLTNYQQQKVTVRTVDDDRAAYSESGDSPTATVTPFDDVAPSAVTGLVATRGDGRVTLTWESESGVESDRAGVRVYVDGALATSVAAATTTYTATGLTNDRQYSFYLVAYDARPSGYGPAGSTAPNTSAASSTVRATPTDLTPPSAPTNVTAVRGDTTATLTWTRSPESDVAGYGVVDENGNVLATYNSASTTSATLSGLTNGRTYRLRLVAADTHNNTSAPSTEVSVTPATPPAARTGLGATPGDTTVRLTWNAATADSRTAAAATIRVLVNGALRTTVDGTATSATVTGLTNGTKYTFSLVAVDSEGRTSPESTRVEATPRTPPPSAPTDFTAVRGDTTAALTWTRPPENSLDRYGLVDENGNVIATYPASATSATLTGLTNGRTYRLRLVAADNSNTPSPPSTEVSVTPATPPIARTGLTATRGDTQVTLTWDAPVSDPARAVATTLKVLVDGALRTTLSGTATSATITGLTNDVEYSFTLVAYDAEGRPSPTTTPVKATPTDLAPPSAPTNLTAVRGDTTADLSWTAPPESDTAGYHVITDDGTVLATVPAGTTTYRLTGLSNGTPYRLHLVSLDTHGNPSSPSNEVTVTPLAPPVAITGLVATVSGNAVDLTWGAPVATFGHTDATRVQVHRVGQPDELLATVPVGPGTYQVTGYVPGSVVSFYVVALDADDRPSPRSDVASTGLGAPTDVRGVSGDTAATISWSAVPTATGYRVERYDGTTWVSAGSTTTATTLTVTNLTNQSDVRFRVVATGAGGVESAFSVEVTVRVGYTPPSSVPADGSAGAVGLAASRDGRYVVVPVKNGSATDLVRIDRLSADRVTIESNVGGGALGRAAISSDGRYVVVITATAHDAQNDRNGVADVYRYDVVAGTWAWVSAPYVATPIDTSAVVPGLTTASLSTPDQGPTLAVSSDGNRVFFLSLRQSLVRDDQSNTLDLFVRDVTAGTTTRVTQATGPRPVGTGFAVTPDGAFALYASTGPSLLRQQVSGGAIVEIRSTTGFALSPQQGAGTLAISDDGRRVLAMTGSSGSFTMVQADTAAATSSGTGYPRVSASTVAAAEAGGGQLAISPDGRYGFVATSRALLPSDTNGHVDVYRVDLSSPTDASTTVLLTSGPGGASSTITGESASVALSEQGKIIALDGSRVVVVTQRPLIAGDGNKVLDAYGIDVGAAADDRSHPLVGGS